MGDTKVSAEEGFRESLKDLIVVADRLKPFCNTTEDLVGMCNLALENDGQLRLLMQSVQQGKR